ncbi:uncharacterized protein LOC116655121 isoform X2 [Drosophila ananassae]|uniref:uncharacterized protein LOC116655121 isoform X2 n=1 Tax=Drosophila ananassae TaxID=7217 RepID=UPI0013A5C362|nr:uncharacterized protein LOC116655121 isoform X2 [Drosophila ananassae]
MGKGKQGLETSVETQLQIFHSNDLHCEMNPKREDNEEDQEVLKEPPQSPPEECLIVYGQKKIIFEDPAADEQKNLRMEVDRNQARVLQLQNIQNRQNDTSSDDDVDDDSELDTESDFYYDSETDSGFFSSEQSD